MISLIFLGFIIRQTFVQVYSIFNIRWTYLGTGYLPCKSVVSPINRGWCWRPCLIKVEDCDTHVDPGADGSCYGSLRLLCSCYRLPKVLPQALACSLRRGEIRWVFETASDHCCLGCSWTCRFKGSSWLSLRIAGLGSDTQEPSNLLH